MVVVQSMTLVNDCDGMTIVVGLPTIYQCHQQSH
jgi:hypothetical protein